MLLLHDPAPSEYAQVMLEDSMVRLVEPGCFGLALTVDSEDASVARWRLLGFDLLLEVAETAVRMELFAGEAVGGQGLTCLDAGTRGTPTGAPTEVLVCQQASGLSGGKGRG
jgi:hypothetical protein